MEKHYAGQSIEDIMGEKEKQTPGKRYQLQMFLQNILEVDTEEFVLIGEELLNSNNVRYYMKFVFYELMGQIQKPDENIIEFFLENCDNVIWGKYLINNVALSRKQYVGILMENGTLERWYSEEDKKSQVFKLLVSISPKLGNNEIEFIRNHAFEDSENDKEFMKCFLHDITEESDEMKFIFTIHYTFQNGQSYKYACHKHKSSAIIKQLIFPYTKQLSSFKIINPCEYYSRRAQYPITPPNIWIFLYCISVHIIV